MCSTVLSKGDQYLCNNHHTRLYSLAKSIKYRGSELLDPFPYRRYMRRHRCIFIHVPKAAGTSIRSHLGAFSKVRDHFGYDIYQAANPVRFEKYFKFSFVRNPWDRAVSVYEYLRNGGNGKSDQALADQVNEYRDFCEFANDMLTTEGLHLNKLLRPQFTFLVNPNGQLMVDFLGRFENLETDYQRVLDKLNLRGSIQHLNKGRPRDYRNFYDSKTAELIGRVYKLDAELFDYSFER